jgi:CRP-like cAMP-binding protein
MDSDSFTFDESRRNYLLSALPSDEFERIRPGLELISLEFGSVLVESGERSKYAYFPTTAILARLYLTENGTSTEIGMVGNDGMLGIELWMGDELTMSRAVVHSSGKAFRLSTAILKAAFAEGRAFHDLLLRYAFKFITQISQTAVCNRHHPIEKKVARWLLQTSDYSDSDAVTITQDWTAQMLGVRRESVTVAEARLTDMGLIKNGRGNVTILDRPGLELAACECYDVISGEYNGLQRGSLSRTFNFPNPRIVALQ